MMGCCGETNSRSAWAIVDEDYPFLVDAACRHSIDHRHLKKCTGRCLYCRPIRRAKSKPDPHKTRRGERLRRDFVTGTRGDFCVLQNVCSGSVAGLMGVITGLEVQKRNKKRVNVFVDDEFAFSLSLDEAARLRKGQSLTDADVAALQGEDAVKRAVDSAARLLTSRPRSLQEIRKKLIEKETPPPVIEAAIAKLTALGYIDDHAFATFWAAERNAHKPISPQALRYELRQKGISDAIIGEVLATMSPDDSAARAARGRAPRLRGSTRREFRESVSGFLLRRGFAYAVVKSTITELIEELETDDPAFFASEDGEETPDDFE